MRREIWIVFAVAAGVGFLALWQGRDYPWQLALLVGLAVGALVYATLRTALNIRALATREPPTMEWTDATPSIPPPRPAADASNHGTAHLSGGGPSS